MAKKVKARSKFLNWLLVGGLLLVISSEVWHELHKSKVLGEVATSGGTPAAPDVVTPTATAVPTATATAAPTEVPTTAPTTEPTTAPMMMRGLNFLGAETPTPTDTPIPTPSPTEIPTAVPTAIPTVLPGPAAPGGGGASLQMQQQQITQPQEQQQQSQPAQPTQAPSYPSSNQGIVQTIIKYIPIIVAPTRAPVRVQEEKIVTVQKAITEKTVSQILSDLQAIPEIKIKPSEEVRLQIKGSVDGTVGLVQVNLEGVETPIPKADATKIIKTLEEGGQLVITKLGNGLLFSHAKTVASTDLPLFVDVQKGALNVKSSVGTKILGILPDSALQKALESKGINITGTIKLIERDDGRLAYEVTGISNRKLLGLLSIGVKRVIDVSAINGKILPVPLSFEETVQDWILK